MSKIQEQIKALQEKQKKIDYVSYVADLIKNDTKCVDYKDVQEEIVGKIEPFLLQLIESIEKDAEPQSSQSAGTFTEEQATALKTLADRVLQKPVIPQVNNQAFSSDTPPPVKPAQPANQLSHNDKMNFALNNRHLAQKRVQVLNDQNAPIYGTVVGLDAPHVVVKTETGPTINVPVEKIVPV